MTKAEPKHDVVDAVRVTPGEPVPPLNPAVARQLAAGTQMLKVSAKKQHSRLFKLDLEQGRILWDSRKFGRSKSEKKSRLMPVTAIVLAATNDNAIACWFFLSFVFFFPALSLPKALLCACVLTIVDGLFFAFFFYLYFLIQF